MLFKEYYEIIKIEYCDNQGFVFPKKMSHFKDLY